MRDFFKGWKRKIGVVTLGLACLFAAGWVHGQPRGSIRFSFGSKPEYLFKLALGESGIGYSIDEFTELGHEWHEWTYWDSGEVPWSVSLPLTLLSAYLLLSKPRPAKNQPDDTKTPCKTFDPRC